MQFYPTAVFSEAVSDPTTSGVAVEGEVGEGGVVEGEEVKKKKKKKKKKGAGGGGGGGEGGGDGTDISLPATSGPKTNPTGIVYNFELSVITCTVGSVCMNE